MLLSIPTTRCARRSKKVTSSEPIRPLEPVARTFIGGPALFVRWRGLHSTPINSPSVTGLITQLNQFTSGDFLEFPLPPDTPMLPAPNRIELLGFLHRLLTHPA